MNCVAWISVTSVLSPLTHPIASFISDIINQTGGKGKAWKKPVQNGKVFLQKCTWSPKYRQRRKKERDKMGDKTWLANLLPIVVFMANDTLCSVLIYRIQWSSRQVQYSCCWPKLPLRGREGSCLNYERAPSEELRKEGKEGWRKMMNFLMYCWRQMFIDGMKRTR